MDELKEAYSTINEWGIYEDNFIAHKFRLFMTGGYPDNSIQLSEFFQTQLRFIVDLGLKEAKKTIEEDAQVQSYLEWLLRKCGVNDA